MGPAALPLVGRALCKTTLFIHSQRSISTSCVRLSGHNRWSKIRHGKALADASKSAMFSKCSAEITAAARRGGSTDPEKNVSLAIALAKAKKLYVPKDNVEAALKRAIGPASGDVLQEVTYEALGPSGIPCLIDCVTDNPTRTIARVKEMLNKYGGRMADVRYMFEPKSVISCTPLEGLTFDEIFELAIEGGAEDVETLDDGVLEITAPPSVLHALTTLLAPKTNISSAEIVQMSESPSDEPDEATAQQLHNFETSLEEHADCIRVWHA